MRFKRMLGNVAWSEVAGLLAMVVVAGLLWDTRLVYPLKVLVVFFHEMSHALAGVLTGGSVERIELVAEEGGMTYVLGGNAFVTASAGYLGSLLWGGLLLVLIARTRQHRWVSILLGALLLTVTLWLVRPVFDFGFMFGVAAGAGLIAMGRWLGNWINDLVLRLIGLTSCFYAVLDIKSDVLDRPELRSDARMLAEQTGVPTMVWGIVWITVAVVVGGYLLLLACQHRGPRAAAGKPGRNDRRPAPGRPSSL